MAQRLRRGAKGGDGEPMKAALFNSWGDYCGDFCVGCGSPEAELNPVELHLEMICPKCLKMLEVCSGCEYQNSEGPRC